MDSGALSHMIVYQGTLSNYFPSLSRNSHIVVGNGSHLPILGLGHSHLQAPSVNFLLAFVLHTPSLVSNLISVHKFTKDNWCSIEFDPFGFFVKVLTTNTLLLRSNSLADLYLFAGSTASTNNFALSTFVPSVDVWHRRLILSLPPFHTCCQLIALYVLIICRDPRSVRHAKHESMFGYHFNLLNHLHTFLFNLFIVICGPMWRVYLALSIITSVPFYLSLASSFLN
jgi:hypothetical protein